MGTIWQWGIGLIVAIQSVHGPVLDAIFRAISFLGEEEFYLLLFPALLWCVDKRLGLRLGIIFLVSIYLNSLVKELFAHPRPFDLNPGLKLVEAQGYGLPSGHAQSAVVIWGGLAAWRRRTAVWIGAGLLAGLIGFSRVYLGAHFPTDVLAGWVLGALVLAAGLWAAGHSSLWNRRFGLPARLVVALGAPAILAAVFPDSGAVSATGALAGVSVGAIVGGSFLKVSALGPWWQRVLRFLLGAVVLAAVYLGLRLVFPPPGDALHLVFRFVRYAALGLWISLGAPWVFGLVRLAPRLAIRPAAAGVV